MAILYCYVYTVDICVIFRETVGDGEAVAYLLTAVLFDFGDGNAF